jgi:hypothetical protein
MTSLPPEKFPCALGALGWLILMAIGLVSAASLWLFNRWLEKQKA